MKIKSLFFAATMLLAVFTSCSKDETPDVFTPGVEVEGESDVYIQISEGMTAGTRAEATPVADGTIVSFNDGYIFFVENATGDIKKSFTIGTGKDYTLTQLKSGTTFTAIPNSANVVYVVANQVFTGQTSEGGNINTLLEEATDLSEQTDINNGVGSATLVGEANLVASSRPNVSREAEDVTPEPIIGRIELGKVSIKETVLNPADPTHAIVKSFKIAGIFINNFYYEAPVHGGFTNTLEQPYQFGRIPANYDLASNGGQYKDAWENYMFDLYSPFSDTGVSAGAIADVNGSAVPSVADKVWAYNLFSTPGDLPRIVIHLKDVTMEKYNDDSDVSQGTTGEIDYDNQTTGDATAYLTVQKYTDLATNTLIETIATGKVYKIEDLQFVFTDLTDVPEEKVIDPDDEFRVWVSIHLMSWQAVKVEGGF